MCQTIHIADLQYIAKYNPIKNCKETLQLIRNFTHNANFFQVDSTAQEVNIVDRIIYYTCRLIDRMGKKGSEWDYKDIKKVYYTSTIALS